MTESLAARPLTKRQAWLIGIRPASLSASIVPVLVGTAAAQQRHLHRPLAFAAALLAAMLIQIGTNFANDVFDFRSGADNEARMGPRRLIMSGAISPREAATAAAATFAVAALLGIYLITVGGLPILVVGVLSILSGLIYTGGPWPVGYHGLGDIFAFTFFGVVGVVFSAYLQTLSITTTAVLASLPVGFLITAILVVNNLRDLETDRRVGKLTLATRIGARATRFEYVGLVVAAYLVPPVIWLVTGRDGLFWLTLLSLPLAMRGVRGMAVLDGPALNLMLKVTGQLNLAFGLLFALGLWLS
jgi:1,4-dihydroxy-2-naphthoate polyprenyltransferase